MNFNFTCECISVPHKRLHTCQTIFSVYVHKNFEPFYIYFVIIINTSHYEIIGLNPTSVTGWCKTPLSARLPCGPTALPANFSFVDASWSHSVYTAYISGWMNNLTGEGENSTIHRNDSILFLIYALSGMTSFSRDVSELSTKNTTRSDQTQMYNNIPLIKV